MIGRTALLVSVAVASVTADPSRPLPRGSFCPAAGGLNNGNWPKGWDKCPASSSVSYPIDDCCVPQCMEQLLVNPDFTVCAGNDHGGQAVDGFDWATHYCDCSFKEYCTAVCNPDCRINVRETGLPGDIGAAISSGSDAAIAASILEAVTIRQDIPLISRFNQVKGEHKEVVIQPGKNDTDAEYDAFKFQLRHDSRNLCPVFFFAIFQTANVYAIDWTQSVLVKPWYFKDGREYRCEDIIVEFADHTDSPQCALTELIYPKEHLCGVQLPREFESNVDDCKILSKYVAYSDCGFREVKVLAKQCYDGGSLGFLE